MTHLDLNKTFMRGIMKTSPRGFMLCESSCKPILNNTQGYGMNYRTASSWVQTITPNPRPPSMTSCAITKSRCHNANHIHQPGRWIFSRAAIREAEIQYQEKTGDNLRMSRATADRKWDIIWETERHQHLMLSWGQNHCRWYLIWHKWQTIFQKLKSSNQIGSCWAHDPPPDAS